AGFAAAGGVAATFRAEAVALLVAVPAALLWLPDRRRYAAMLYAPIALVVATAAAVAIAARGSSIGRPLTQLTRQSTEVLADIPPRAHAQWQGFADGVLDPHFHDYAGFGVVGGLLTMVLVHIVIAASVPLFVIVCVGASRGSLQRIDPSGRAVLGTAI